MTLQRHDAAMTTAHTTLSTNAAGIAVSREMTLHDTLASLGYTTKPAHQYAKHILDASGATVFTGDSVEVWAWLRGRGATA